MPQEDERAAQVQKSQVVLGLPLPSRGDASKPLQPGEQPLDLPPATVSTKRSTVLLPLAVALDRRDELDVALTGQGAYVLGAVPRLVADQSRGELIHESSIERSIGEYDVVSVSTRNNDSEWKTIAVCDCHDLGRLACPAFPNVRAPLFAGT